MKDKIARPEAKMSDAKTRELVEGLAGVHRLRDSIAQFLAKHCNTVDEFISCCDRNDWNADVAFDFRAAMFQLGCVLATLTLWDREVLPENADQIVLDGKRLEESYARKDS